MQHSLRTRGLSSESSRTSPDNILVVVAPYTSLGEKTVDYALASKDGEDHRHGCLCFLPHRAWCHSLPVSVIEIALRSSSTSAEFLAVNKDCRLGLLRL